MRTYIWFALALAIITVRIVLMETHKTVAPAEPILNEEYYPCEDCMTSVDLEMRKDGQTYIIHANQLEVTK